MTKITNITQVTALDKGNIVANAPKNSENVLAPETATCIPHINANANPTTNATAMPDVGTEIMVLVSMDKPQKKIKKGDNSPLRLTVSLNRTLPNSLLNKE